MNLANKCGLIYSDARSAMNLANKCLMTTMEDVRARGFGSTEFGGVDRTPGSSADEIRGDGTSSRG